MGGGEKAVGRPHRAFPSPRAPPNKNEAILEQRERKARRAGQDAGPHPAAAGGPVARALRQGLQRQAQSGDTKGVCRKDVLQEQQQARSVFCVFLGAIFVIISQRKLTLRDVREVELARA